MTVKRLMAKNKIHQGFISPDAWVAAAAVRLQKAEASALIASYDGRFIEGIISEHDIVGGLSRHGSGVLKMRVSDFMTEDVITCQETDSILSVMQKMVAGKVRHIPVLNSKGKFDGLIAIQDIISDRLEELEDESIQMRDYISGKAA